MTKQHQELVRVAVGLGSNLNNPKQQVQQACQTLKQSDWVNEWRCSSLFYSKPLGPQDQPDFVNAVAIFLTDLTPMDLLEKLQAIEKSQGRVKTRHWGERTIDLDLLLYGDQVMNNERLTVPHPFLTERDFVVQPLLEVWPDVTVPGKGRLTTFSQTLPASYLIK